MGRRTALLVIATHTAVPLKDDWLEQFWCPECDQKRWYHIHETGPRQYRVRLAPDELWQQVEGIVHPDGNPSVGEFTRTQARMVGQHSLEKIMAT